MEQTKRLINLIVIHCTASKETSTLTPQSLEAYHKSLGWTQCGYHFYITRDGRLHYMRPLTESGAHAQGHNANSIGIAYEGGIDANGIPKDTRTTQQKETLLLLLKTLKCSIPQARILGHRDLSPDLNHDGHITPDEYIKQCPCFDASAEYSIL